MTEKRFIYCEEENGEFPFPYIKHDGKKVISLYECVDLLNQLADENEELKARNKYLAMKIQRERNSHMKEHEKWEKEIQKENKQLKKENQEVKDILNELNSINGYWDSALLQEYIDKIANVLGVDLE